MRNIYMNVQLEANPASSLVWGGGWGGVKQISQDIISVSRNKNHFALLSVIYRTEL